MKPAFRLFALALLVLAGMSFHAAAQQPPSVTDVAVRNQLIDSGNDAMFNGDSVTGEKFFRQALAYSEQHNMGPVHIGRAHAALAWPLLEQRRYAEAETEYRTALQMYQGILPESDDSVLQSKLGLGKALTGLGRYQDAEPLLLAAFHGYEADPGITACELSYPLDALTTLYDASRQYNKGESVYTEVFALMTGKRGTPCGHFVAVLDHLAQLYSDDNQWETLEKVERGRAGLVLGMKGPHSVEYGDALSAIAKTLEKRQNWAQAAAVNAQAADAYRHTDPPAWAKLEGSLGQEEIDFTMLGKPEEATKAHEATLAAAKEANAEDPRGEMLSFRDQVLDAERSGDLDKAAQFVAREVAASRQLSPNDQMIALDDSADVHAMRKELPQAEADLKQALAMSIAVTGPASSSTANAHFNLAWFYQRDKSRQADAEASYTAALAIYGPGDTDKVKLALSMLGIAYLKEKKYEQAEPVYQRFLKISEDTHDGYNICLVLMNQVDLYRETHRVPEAEAALQRALTLSQQLPTPQNHEWAAVALTGANFYQETGRPQQAEALYRQIITFIQTKISPDTPSLRLPMDKLIALLKSQGRLSEASQLEASEAKLPPMPAWPGASQ